MAKNLTQLVLFVALMVGFMPLHASIEPSFVNGNARISEQCDAPAPDSFRMTNAGIHFVSLAWQPVWTGAFHTIKVFKKEEGSTTWSYLETFPDVPDYTFTVSNLKYLTQYKFSIATNCSDGTPSEYEAYTGPPIGVILDLVLGGRTPNNPDPAPYCQPILFENYDWVGFKVESGVGLGAIANYFEFGLNVGGAPVIKRPTYGPDLVAARKADGAYPTINVPIIELIEATFDIRRLVNGIPQLPLGILDLTYDPINKTVKICKDIFFPWAPGYIFTMLTAKMVNGFQAPNTEGLLKYNNHFAESITVVNPVKEAIHIFMPKPLCEKENLTISLLNTNGQTVFKRLFEAVENPISFPVENLPPGFYILHLEGLGQIQTFKIVKPE